MKKAHKICPKRKRQRGFTMIELMIVVTLVAVLASIAAPSMRTYVLNSRINSLAQEVLRTLQTARSEATKRQRLVTVCGSANPTADADDVTCAASAITGWIMFEDTDSDGVHDAGEELIAVNTFDTGKLILLGDGIVTYRGDGFAAPGGATALVICDSRGNTDSGGGTTGPSVARGIYIHPIGRAQITRVVSNSTDLHDISDLIDATGGTCS